MRGLLTQRDHHHVLPIVVLACYFAAAPWLIASMQQAASDAQRLRRHAGLLLGTVAWLAHAVLLWRGVAAKPEFALTIAETASLVGFGIAAIALIACWWRPRFGGTAAFFLAIAGLVAVATNEGAREFTIARGGWELSAHIGLSVLAYSLITVGTALAVALALLDRRLHRKQPLGWMSMLPSVDSLESGMFLALGAGFVVLSLALFSGFFFVEDLLAQSLSRKVVLSCVAWLILAVLLFGRWRFGWRGRTARNWALWGFVILVLAYFGSKIVLESILGRHWG